ncbi:50S ribosomal protein L22 [Candidatus Woesearchaeota archaeon]|nr:50S ribosomal protein L22 [Candidatus Woesearchaeota archaeon]
MAEYKYSCNVKENMAKAVSRNMPISRKHCIELCSVLRGKPLERAKTILQNVVDMKEPVPFRKYNHNVGHRKKMGPARFPVNASKALLSLLNTVTANAQMKGLATGKLVICHMNAQQGPKFMKRGRQARMQMKQCHVEVAVMESKEAGKQESKKQEQKKELKKEAPKPVKKEEPKAKPVQQAAKGDVQK